MDIFSFGSSDDLRELEDGLVDLEHAYNQIALAFGLTILRIEEGGLWKQSGLNNLREYRMQNLAKLGIPKQTISTRRSIARGYMDNKDILEGVSLSGRLSKLIRLSKARKIYGDETAMQHFLNDPWAEWNSFVHGR
jgi:hypothetical protein